MSIVINVVTEARAVTLQVYIHMYTITWARGQKQRYLIRSIGLIQLMQSINDIIHVSGAERQ